MKTVAVAMQVPESKRWARLPMTEQDARSIGLDTSQSCSDVLSSKSAARHVSDGHLKSLVIKRSLVVGGHKTSVSLEDVFWNELRWIAKNRHLHLSQLVGRIDADRQHGNLSSAIRLFVFQNASLHAEEG